MLKKKLVKQNNSVEVLEDFSPLKEVTDHLVSAESLLEQGKVDDAFIDFGVAVAKADRINQMEVREQEHRLKLSWLWALRCRMHSFDLTNFERPRICPSLPDLNLQTPV